MEDLELDITHMEFSSLVGCDFGNSVKLKNWLVTFTEQKLKIANHRFVDKSRNINLNTDYIMPYLKNRLYSGNDGLRKLKLSICALLLIYNELGIEDPEELRNDCLRLYIRLNSVQTKFSVADLLALINDCKELVKDNYNRTLELINDECMAFLSIKADNKRKKYKSTKYHYKAEDFSLIYNCSSWKDAYDFWLKYQFPELLDKYKVEVKSKIKLEMTSKLNYGHQLSNEDYQAEIQASGVDNVVIKQLSYKAFKLMVKRLNLKVNF